MERALALVSVGRKIKTWFPRFIREPACGYALPICRRVHAWRGRFAGRQGEGEKEESKKGGREKGGGLRHGGGAYARENTYTTTPGCAYPRPVVVPVSLSLSLSSRHAL